jgi:hypothetical protein
MKTGSTGKDLLRNKVDKFGAGFFSPGKAQNADEPEGLARLCNAARRKKGKPNGEIISEQFLNSSRLQIAQTGIGALICHGVCFSAAA